jgi:hypothetical protein
MVARRSSARSRAFFSPKFLARASQSFFFSSKPSRSRAAGCDRSTCARRWIRFLKVVDDMVARARGGWRRRREEQRGACRRRGKSRLQTKPRRAPMQEAK